MVGNDDGRIWRGFDGGALAADVFSILGDGGQAESGATAHAGIGGWVGGGADYVLGTMLLGLLREPEKVPVEVKSGEEVRVKLGGG